MFRIAGGILLFGIAYNLLKARKPYHQHPTKEEHLWLFEEIEENPKDIAINPLETPILAFPGTITTALSLVGKEATPLIFFMIGLMGLVLSVIAGQMIIEGVMEVSIVLVKS